MILSRLSNILRTAVCVWLLFWVAFFVVKTFHWAQVNDAAQISYAVYLVDHGMAPYKDLIEMNMPGIYLANWSVMHTLGMSDVAWRIFDLSLLGIGAWAMLAIAGAENWAGGLVGAGLLALFHGRDGAAQMGQRDLIIAVLLLAAYAFLFRAMRRESGLSSWLMFCFGACVAASATVKPMALPFLLVLLAAAAFRLWQQRRPMAAPLGAAVAGAAVPLAGVTAFLLREGSLGAFLTMMRQALPYYAPLGRLTLGKLLKMSMTASIETLLLLGLVLAFSCWKAYGDEARWETAMLAIGVLFGMACFLAQGKGFPYHRYPMLGFIFLLAGLQLTAALRQTGWRRIVACAGLLYVISLAPQYAVRAARHEWAEDYDRALQGDLKSLGGGALSGRVQCLATDGDCATTLYRMRLIQATGLFYDYFLFDGPEWPIVQQTRQRFLAAVVRGDTKVIVLDRGIYPQVNEDDYATLEMWPAFRDELAAHYRLVTDRDFPYSVDNGVRGYRIYVRNDMQTATLR